MFLRLTPELGGDGTTTGIIAMNDTGSDILTIFDHDMFHLGSLDNYVGWAGSVLVNDANGGMTAFPKLFVQVQLVGNDDVPWSAWMDEVAVLKPFIDGVSRLSGSGMRSALFFGTPAGNGLLAVASTKHGLHSIL